MLQTKKQGLGIYKDTSTNFGHIVSCFLGIQYGYLHYRYLEANKVDVLKENQENLYKLLFLLKKVLLK